MGGFIHILLVVAIVVVLIRIIQGRKIIWTWQANEEKSAHYRMFIRHRQGRGLECRDKDKNHSAPWDQERTYSRLIFLFFSRRPPDPGSLIFFPGAWELLMLQLDGDNQINFAEEEMSTSSNASPINIPITQYQTWWLEKAA
jgi:hypothetical protein